MSWKKELRSMASIALLSANRAPCLLAAGLLLASGCSDEIEPTAPRLRRAEPAPNLGSLLGVTSLRGNAARQLQLAVAGRTTRGGQDDMLRIEATAPGFGGFYIDENEQVVIMLRPDLGTPHGQVRALINNKYRGSASHVIRTLMSSASKAEVHEAKFSLSQLIEYEQITLHAWKSIPGFVGDGIVIPRNVLEVRVENDGQVSAAQAVIKQLGIPDDAVDVSSIGPIAASANFANSVVRPTRAGPMIWVYDGRYDHPNGSGGTTVVAEVLSEGFNVRLDDMPGQPTVFSTAAHGPNSYYAANGQIGGYIWQPFSPYGIATITTNPAWTSVGCPYGADYCTTADVALGTYLSGVTSQRAVGTSDYQGDNGATGSQHVHGWYAISDTVPPEMVPWTAKTVFKSGQHSGTTSGTINTNFWNSVDSAMAWGNPEAPSSVSVAFLGQVRVDSMGWGRGDSGAPVFLHTKTVGVCNPYCALGLQNSGFGGVSPTTGQCNVGKLCSIQFSKWSAMESWLGVGRLNPKTNP